MNRTCRIPVFLLVVLLGGCSGRREGAHYSWLDKQGQAVAARPSGPTRLELGDEHTGISTVEVVPSAEAKQALPRSKAEQEVKDQTLAAVAGSAFLPVAEEKEPLAFSQERSGTAPGPDTSYYADQTHHWNAKAVAALPVAVAGLAAGIAAHAILLFLIGGAIAFTLGLIGSRQCRDRGDRGKGFAIAGMALGAAVLFLGLLGLLYMAA